MNLERKVEVVRQAIRSITHHEDAAAEDIDQALHEIVRFIASEEAFARSRRQTSGNRKGSAVLQRFRAWL